VGVLAVAFAQVALAAPGQAVPPLLGADSATLPREPLITPQNLGTDPLSGLQFADPTESIDTVQTPTASSQGNAQLSLPLTIPPGRGGVQPDLTVSYDSSGSDGWLGLGWNLDVGSITVDTRWGVPRYSPSQETETYQLNGDELSPTAVRDQFVPRVKGRADFTRRVETQYDLIIRHGDSPSNYWWEVRDKLGDVFWYGGTPDLGGPNGLRPPGETSGLDENAVLRTGDSPDSPIYRWALSAQRDVGVNMIRYSYDTVRAPVGDQSDLGKQMYLRRILYTCASAASGHPEDPAYEVRFLRDGDMNPRPAQRSDPVVDARGGFVQVTDDLLRRVEVWFGKPNADESPRTYNVLSRAFNFNYTEGAFGKTLLKSVDQVGSDGKVYASNKLDYYDDVQRSDGSYDGYQSSQDWSSGPSGGDYTKTLLGQVGLSALGASETTAFGAHAYLGFSPSGPNKDVSLGGALTVSGNVTEALAEMIDLNGDGLPDKVYRKDDGSVWFRLNTSGPHGGTTFGDEHEVNLGGLSSDFGIGVAGGPEAYLGGSVQFDVGADFNVGTAYFQDVNNDGLPDYISNGKVSFNHLDSNGIPTFGEDSSDTKVPLGAGNALSPPHSDTLDKFVKLQRDESPLMDTVRRWVAPFAGTVSIDAPVTYDPPPPDPSQPASSAMDGVRTTIQRGGTELWAARLANPGDSATPTGVDSVTVTRGQAVYFRVQSVDNGNRDQVRWDPKITYTSYASTNDTPVPDVNGLSQSTFDSGADFTLAGRPDAQIVMPLTGTVRFDAVLRKTKPTTDDVEVLVLKDGVPVIDRKISADTVNAAGIDVGGSFDVLASDSSDPNAPPPGSAENVTVKIRVDSPIDISALQWTPRLYYTSASKDGQAIPTTNPTTGQPSIELAVPADIDIYPNNDLAAPAKPWSSDIDGPATVHADVGILPEPDGSAPPDPTDRIFLTVKQRGKLIGKAPVVNGTADVPVNLKQGEDYWFDLSVRDDTTNLSELIGTHSVVVRTDSGSEAVPHTLNWTGRQGVFPISYRGWGYAGYNGDGARASQPIDESAFVLNKSNFPTSSSDAPTGFDPNIDSGSSMTDSSYKNPINGDSWPFTAYQLALKDASGNVVGSAPVWRGLKDDMVGGADFARSSRRGVDDPSAITEELSGSGAHGVTRLGITGPTLSIVASALFVGASVALGPSFGLIDQLDLNGDGFPDVVTPGSIQYTGPRGGYVDSGDGPSVVNQDATFGFGVGFNGSAVDVKANSKGKANTAQESAASGGAWQRARPGGAAGQGKQASQDQYGLTVGGQAGISAQYTNPGAAGQDLSGFESQIGTSAPAEQTFADVNGDGLPDRVTVSGDGVYVELNTGYGFTKSIKWADDPGFEAEQSYSGSVGIPLGFTWEYKEFGGGLAYNESIDFPTYSWVDVNGDGILDRLAKHTDGSVTVAFGTGNGLLPDVDYGQLQTGSYDIGGNVGLTGAGIPTGEQIAQDKTQGLGADADFTIPIWLGPECPPCYILINPGVSADQSFSSSEIQLADINGDGVPDSLQSTSDGTISASLDKVGRTNLLRSVSNSLGGQIRLDYQRQGNTVDHPSSTWALSSVETDDGRPGDGADTLLSTFEYSGGNYSQLERQDLGYSKVVERQRVYQGDGNVYDDPVIRSVERDYRNDSVFDSGLQTSEKMTKPDGTPVKETRTDWQLVDVSNNHVLDTLPAPNDPALFGISAAPQQTKVEQFWYDKNGAVGEHTWNTFQYDDLGNVVKQVDVGQPDDPNDDLTAITTPTSCDISSSDALNAYFGGCPAPTPQGRISPLWNPHRCPTWVSEPAKFQILDAAGHVLRSRDGAPALCDNQSVTDLKETLGNGNVAETTLNYDDWGNYNCINYPANASGQQYSVYYVYDPNNHTNVAEVDDSHGSADPCNKPGGPHATATFDGRTGRIASRTDVNGQSTSYAYDAAGRIASITGPYEQGTGHSTARFEYFPTSAGYAYALAHNYDAFNPSDPIDTATFVDGDGRVTQTKQDASVFTGAGSAPADVMVVSGAREFDALGRPVKQWYPTTEPLGSIGTFNTGRASTDPTVTTWNLNDQVTNVQHPNGTNTATDYAFGGQSDFGASLFTATVTDANGKQQRTYSDVRDNVRAVDDMPSGAPVMRTKYLYDPLGQLTSVIDPGGNATKHTYDLLGRRTSTQTPDGGLVQYNFDGASNLVSQVTPNLRAAGQQIKYSYDQDRLTGIDYPAGTPSVTYTYGTADTGGGINGIGRIIAVEDGARSQQLTYDPLGQVATDTSTMQLHNLNTSTATKATFKTGFTYDDFGRMRTVSYPDGEVVTNDYDSGGLLNKVSGVKGANNYGYVDRLEYDEFFDRRFQQTGNGVQTLYTYDPLTRRLASQVTDTPVRRIQALNYTYDKVGNVLKLDDQMPAPQPDLYGGPGSQTYHYDPYYRLSAAEGTYTFAPGKTRNYTYNAGYDVNGNVISKSQTDVITSPGSSPVTQAPTTYTENPISYSATKPHEITKIGTRSYSYDADGNFTGWTEAKGGQRRTVTWDATDKMRSVADQGSTTNYTYDEAGHLAILRGSSGETAFVNPWYTVRNATERWKEIWAGNDRVASQKVADDGSFEFRYFLHKDLQGSTNMVTDNNALVFQHLEWFPAGEPWISEQSTTNRTPYQYAGGYLDDTRNLTSLGARWYEPREQFLYSPDATLRRDPSQTIGDPGLLSAYSYAEQDPVQFVDSTGSAPSAARTALTAAFGVLKRPNQPATQVPAYQAAVQTAVAAATGQTAAAGAAPADSGASSQALVAVAPGSAQSATGAPQQQDSRLTKLAGRLNTVAELLGGFPLLEVNLVKTDDGFSLHSLEASPTLGLKQFSIPFKRKASKAATPATGVAIGSHRSPPPAGH
jgi:RHS repeat-associated protein